jgi:hypothetical protein
MHCDYVVTKEDKTDKKQRVRSGGKPPHPPQYEMILRIISLNFLLGVLNPPISCM